MYVAIVHAQMFGQGKIKKIWLIFTMSDLHIYLLVLSENFYIVYTNETEELSLGVTPTCGEVEVGGATVLPVPRSLEGWVAFERNGRGAATPRQ